MPAREEGETQWNPSFLNSNPDEVLLYCQHWDLFALQVKYLLLSI